MNLEKITRTALMSGFFLLLFATRPGFGKLNLEHYNPDINGEMTRLTDGKVRIFKKDSHGFDLHCANGPAKKSNLHADDNTGFLSRAFIQ